MAASDLQDILSITGAILPGIQRTRQRAEDKMAAEAAAKVEASLHQRQRELALGFNKIAAGDPEQQGLIRTSQDVYNARIRVLQEKKTLEGSRSISDLEISQDERLIKTFGSLKAAIDQAGPRDKSSLRLQTNRRFTEELANYPGDPSFLIELRDATLDKIGASPALGDVDQSQVVTAAQVRKKYGEVNIENFTALTIIRQQANTSGVAMDQITNLNLGQNAIKVMQDVANLSTENIRQQWILDVTQTPGDFRLSGTDQLDQVLQKLAKSETDMIEFITGAVQKDTKRGGGPVNQEGLRKVIKSIQDGHQVQKEFYTKHTDIRYYKALNNLALETMKRGAGSEIDHITKAVSIGGPKVRDILLRKLLLTGEPQEAAQKKWDKILSGLGLEMNASNMAKFSSKIGDRVPDKQTSFWTLPFAMDLVASTTPKGEVEDGVIGHATNGLWQVIDGVGSVPGAVEQFGRGDFPNKILGGSSRVQTDFVEVNNKMVKMMIRDVAVQGNTITYDENANLIKVTKTQVIRKADFIPGGVGKPGMQEGERVVIVDKVASRAFTTYYKKMINSGTYSGLLPGADDWFKEVAKVAKEFKAPFIHPIFSPSLESVQAHFSNMEPTNIKMATDLLDDIGRNPEFVKALESSTSVAEVIASLQKSDSEREARSEANRAAAEKVDKAKFDKQVAAAQRDL